MAQRILTQLRGSEIIPLVEKLNGLFTGNGETVGEILDKKVLEPKLRLKYEVALTIAVSLRDAPFAVEDIRLVLVWGEEGDYRGQVRPEFRFSRPVSVQKFEAWLLGMGSGVLD